MKIGIEVEGRFKGLRTLFMGYGEFFELKSFEDIEGILRDKCLQQVYISDLDNRIELRKQILRDMSKVAIVTLERTFVDGLLPEHVRIVLSVPVRTDMRILRPGDQIKIDQHQHVWEVSKESMITSIPSDFLNDVHLPAI